MLNTWNTLVLASVVGILAVTVVICLISVIRHRMTIARLRRSAALFVEGDLSHRFPVAGPPGLVDLSQTLNQTIARLERVVNNAQQQRHEQDAVLASMVEGVLAIDREERLMSLNVAAAQILEVDPVRSVGRSIQEVVRNTALQQFVAQMLRSASPLQADIALRVAIDAPPAGQGGLSPTSSDRFLQAQGATLRDPQGKQIGALIVLHDVTRLRRLEAVRRDFVANVSHEVKTPVAAIKASVETLLDSHPINPEDAERFLRMIQRQSDRLEALVNDLLTLARVEQDAERHRVILHEGRLSDVLATAVEACQLHASAKHIQLELSADPTMQARINPRLLEHAVINLIDNAVKYSPENTTIRIGVQRADHEWVIAVTDQGQGIEAEHLPRIFERFYRPDRARNRAQGGTGLGLAIVKHSAQSHGGTVSVESVPGQGSTFRIHLPVS